MDRIKQWVRGWSRRTFALVVAGVLVLPAALAFGWQHLRFAETHESTDDAYVDGGTTTVTSRVAGTVIAVSVGTNWSIDAGQLMVQLDPQDFQVKLDEAQARLERARQTVDQLHAEYEAAVSALALSGEQLHQAEIDFGRAHKLTEAGVNSRESYERAETGLRIARANRDLADHRVQQARAALGSAPDAPDRYDTPMVHEAEAAVAAAKLALGYTQIHAPLGGTVVNKHVEVGDRVQEGQPLMNLVPPSSSLYVTANFKETQLAAMRPGQPVDVDIDAIPAVTFHGRIDSFQPGTGSEFSVLPAENATGNYVKIVQRLPVKIDFDDARLKDYRISPGLSVVPTVRVR